MDDFQFFASLRNILAIRQGQISLADVVIDAIENKILPEIQDKYEEEDDIGKKEEIEEQIEMWEDYANESREGKIWNKEGAKVVSHISQKYDIPDREAEDIANEIAAEFYANDRMRSIFDDFDIDTGPIGLLKLFKKTVANAARDILKKRQREQERDVSMQTPTEGDEGDSGELGDFIEDAKEGDLERKEIEEVREDLARWMRKELKDDQKLLFNMWFELSEDKDPGKIRWYNDIFPQWHEQTGKGKTMLDRHKKEIYQKIIEYFKNELNFDVGHRTLENLHLASAVTKRFWRCKFAQWMLQPIYN